MPKIRSKSDFIQILSSLLPFLIAVRDEVRALLCVLRRDLPAVKEDADEAATEEAEPADEVPAEGPLELGEPTVIKKYAMLRLDH